MQDNTEKYARWAALKEDGLTCQQIADQEGDGTTKNMVVGALNRRRKNKPIPPDRLERGKIWHELHAGGFTYPEIAAQHSIESPSTVSSIVSEYRKKFGIAPVGNRRQRITYPHRAARVIAEVLVPAPHASIPFPEASGSNLCLWPEGPQFERSTHWCGKQRACGSYCAEHNARAYALRRKTWSFMAGI